MEMAQARWPRASGRETNDLLRTPAEDEDSGPLLPVLGEKGALEEGDTPSPEAGTRAGRGGGL